MLRTWLPGGYGSRELVRVVVVVPDRLVLEQGGWSLHPLLTSATASLHMVLLLLWAGS